MGRSPANKLKRKERIAEELRVNSVLRVNALAQEFNVSDETIRRDLAQMASEGLVNRTYGGAVALPISTEPAWSVRHAVHRSERADIARAARRLVMPGDIVMLELGSTVMHLAEELAQDARDLTVVTTSLVVALALGRNPSINVLVCPGALNTREGGVTGSEAERYLERYNATIAFVGSTGITAEGLQESDIAIGTTKRSMLARAKKRVALLDHTKFNQASLSVAVPLREIDLLVTDRAPVGDLGLALQRAGSDILVEPGAR